MDPIALVCAVELESLPMLGRMTSVEVIQSEHHRAWRGRMGRRTVLLLEGGMGKTNAAHSATILLERERIESLIGFGIAGAYPGSELRLRDIALAESEIYGDEGVDTPAGWISTEGIGIPLLEIGETRLYNHFPVDPGLLSAASEALDAAGLPYRIGPFVTVSCCSGRAERGRELAGRHGAVCETMEGAAHAHIAAAYGVPFIELRSVSNFVEDRDLSRWNLVGAAGAAASAVERVVLTL